MTELRRTPLYEQHRRPWARSSCRSPAGRCRSRTRGSGRSTRRCGRTRGCSTSPTWARSRSRGRARSPFCSGSSPTTSPRSTIGGAQYSCLCNEDGGVLDDLFAYRLGGDRYLIVTNAANHETDLAWLGRWSRGFDVAVRDVADRYAMLAVQGPHARAVLGARAGDRAAAADARRRRPGRPPPGARLRHRLHRRGRGRAAARPRGRGADLGRAARRRRRPLRPRRPRHAAAGGLLPAARQRADPGAQPDRGRPRLVLRGGDRVPRLRGGRRGPRRGHRREAGPVPDRGRRHPARRQPGARRRRAGRRRHQRHLLALAGARRRHGLRARRPGRARDRAGDRRPRQASRRPGSVPNLSTEKAS